jgi:hypothetical protein
VLELFIDLAKGRFLDSLSPVNFFPAEKPVIKIDLPEWVQVEAADDLTIRIMPPRYDFRLPIELTADELQEMEAARAEIRREIERMIERDLLVPIRKAPKESEPWKPFPGVRTLYHEAGRFRGPDGRRFDYVFPELIKDPTLPPHLFPSLDSLRVDSDFDGRNAWRSVASARPFPDAGGARPRGS